MELSDSSKIRLEPDYVPEFVRHEERCYQICSERAYASHMQASIPTGTLSYSAPIPISYMHARHGDRKDTSQHGLDCAQLRRLCNNSHRNVGKMNA